MKDATLRLRSVLRVYDRAQLTCIDIAQRPEHGGCTNPRFLQERCEMEVSTGFAKCVRMASSICCTAHSEVPQ
jgi:hypothetical protein